MFNFTVLNFSAISGLYGTLEVDKYLGRPMPQNFTNTDYLNLRHLSHWYHLFGLNFDLAKAFDTNIIKRILQDFDDRINNLKSKPLKWTSISAHDTNIIPMLNDLNISSAACV